MIGLGFAATRRVKETKCTEIEIMYKLCKSFDSDKYLAVKELIPVEVCGIFDCVDDA